MSWGLLLGVEWWYCWIVYCWEWNSDVLSVLLPRLFLSTKRNNSLCHIRLTGGSDVRWTSHCRLDIAVVTAGAMLGVKSGMRAESLSHGRVWT